MFEKNVFFTAAESSSSPAAAKSDSPEAGLIGVFEFPPTNDESFPALKQVIFLIYQKTIQKYNNICSPVLPSHRRSAVSATVHTELNKFAAMLLRPTGAPLATTVTSICKKTDKANNVTN